MADSRNLPPAENVSVVDDDLGINEDEREEIEREIDALVSAGGRESTLSPEFLNPRRSGFGLPILIWILAGAAFAAGFFVISNYFQVREESVALESRAYFTTEAQLIEEILRESEERLAEKDQEITQIQDRLALLDAEKQDLEQNLEDQVAARAAELRRELEADLAAERARLADAGRSQSEIDRQIQALETEREAEVAAQIDAFRAQARAELDELEQQLEAQQAQLQQALVASREERLRLAQEAAQRESELREEFTREIAELEDAERAALARIDELQALREAEQLITDRILGSFTVIVQDIEEGLTDEALAGLASLERLLLDERLGSGERQRRRQTELALVGTLRALVQDVDVLRENIAIRDLTTSGDETSRLEQERAADLIRLAGETVALAESAREAGRYAEARSLYQQALSTIPSLDRVYPGILDLESTRRQVALAAAMSEAQSLLAAGSGGPAVERYLESIRALAANDDDPLLAVADGIDAAVRRARIDLLESQDELEDEYEARLTARDERVDELSRSLAATRSEADAAAATVSSLRDELAGARRDLATVRESVARRDALLASLQSETAAIEDDLAAARTDLVAARGRSASLQESLASTQARAQALENEVAELESQAADLRTRLAAREEARPSAADAAPDGATLQQIQELTRTISEHEETIQRLEGEVDGARSALGLARSDAEELRADLQEANARVEGMEARIAALQASRETTTGETDELRRELETLQSRVAELESLEEEIDALTNRYESALASAQNRIEDGEYERARSRMLEPFSLASARRIFPGFVGTLTTVERGITEEARARSADEARSGTLADVAELATQVQQNIDSPRESVGVQSYLRREPDLGSVADELFEIVELSARAISAPEIEYRLLGSVSRVSANLIVVERLVALEATVGDEIEIRRAPTLGQEIPIAAGTILEVTDQRVVASVGEVYELDAGPATRDLVYIAQR